MTSKNRWFFAGRNLCAESHCIVLTNDSEIYSCGTNIDFIGRDSLGGSTYPQPVNTSSLSAELGISIAIQSLHVQSSFTYFGMYGLLKTNQTARVFGFGLDECQIFERLSTRYLIELFDEYQSPSF